MLLLSCLLSKLILQWLFKMHTEWVRGLEKTGLKLAAGRGEVAQNAAWKRELAATDDAWPTGQPILMPPGP
ncbi:hypothetical protein MOMUL_09690 [Moorella mulderi DSM 14980]|uniref:Uncharacterized protein n=2 Tax=Neomoorella TaxID=44260 RepID=A0A151AZV0_9FIRM|nr:hypothetical protein MOMUL_09690 [Moorella mulderi DSM 14980]